MRTFIVIGISLLLFSGCAGIDGIGEKFGLASLERVEQDRIETGQGIGSLQSRIVEAESRLDGLETRVHSLEPKVISQGREVDPGRITISEGKIIINE